jgi:NAD(P)H-hydrate epimerase
MSEARRLASLVVGPGLGRRRLAADWVEAALATGLPCVVDADGLTAFRDDPGRLFAALRGRAAVLTPHDGEFARLFEASGDKLSRARAAARISGAVVLLKGSDTVVAAPDGRAAINDNAPPWLATAGAGDVLAGAIAALLAQRTDPFEAACAGAWLTGDAANRVGEGLIADDLAAALPESLAVACYGD